MSNYQFSQSKVIDEITFRKSEGGQLRAYLHAKDGTDPALLRRIIESCAAHDWQCTPANEGGKAVLEVLGGGNEPAVIGFLRERGWVEGAHHYTAGKENKLNVKQQILKRSLAASGAFFVVGDLAFTQYGYAGGDKLNMAAGALYGAGTASLLLLGRKDQSDLQVRDIAKRLDQYLKEQGANLPNECSLDSIIHDHGKGLIKKTDDLLRRYPSELMNLFYAGAGACIAKSAYNHMHSPISQESHNEVYNRLSKKNPELDRGAVHKKMEKFHKLESKLDIGLGAMTGVSGLFAMSVKEKARDPDAPKKEGLSALWEKIQNKPLAVAGIGYMLSTMCHAVSTGVAWQYADDARRRSVPWRAIFVGSNIVAEILLALSSKGHGDGVKSDNSVDNTAIALAADLIVQQPARMQEGLIEHVSRFLGSPQVLAISNEQATKLLRAQVALMRKNPWALSGVVDRTGVEQPCAEVPAATPANATPVLPLAKPPAAAVVPSWQAKVAPKDAAPHPSLPG